MADRSPKAEALHHLEQLQSRAATSRAHRELGQVASVIKLTGDPIYAVAGFEENDGLLCQETILALQGRGFEVTELSGTKETKYQFGWSVIKRSLMVPTIHPNGTSRDYLLESYKHAADAVRDAIIALDEAAPHGRDYYPQGQGAIDHAIEEHRERLMKLADVISELEQIAQAIGA